MNDLVATMTALQKALSDAQNLDVMKNFTQPAAGAAGLQGYSLETPAKFLYPLMTPFRNKIPRRDSNKVAGGTRTNWKAITGINTTNLRASVSDGQRGGVIAQTSADYFGDFKGWGLENNVTFEANWAAGAVLDARSTASLKTLQSVMVSDEKLIVGGNASLALGTTPTPTLATATTGGTIAAGTTNSVICVALGYQAYLDMVGANNGATGQTFDPTVAKVNGQITRTNANGTTTVMGDGSAQQSAAGTITTTGSTSTISASVTAVKGAFGYAWYLGATAGAERLATVTTINSVVMTLVPLTPNQLASAINNPAADNSTNSLEFDGLLTQALKSGSNAYFKSMATGTAGTGTPLTADGAGGIVEFEAAFAQFYNLYRISPNEIYVNAQELLNINKKCLAGSGTPLLQLLATIGQSGGSFTAGVRVGKYLNKITNQEVDIIIHPNMPAGTIFFYSTEIPYALNDTPDLVRMLMRQDYYQIDWPITARRYDYGVYADGLLQHYAPFTMGVITNIANG